MKKLMAVLILVGMLFVTIGADFTHEITHLTILQPYKPKGLCVPAVSSNFRSNNTDRQHNRRSDGYIFNATNDPLSDISTHNTFGTRLLSYYRLLSGISEIKSAAASWTLP